jgi:hypothetical protein
MDGYGLWEMSPAFARCVSGDFPSFFGGQAVSARATTLFATKLPQLDRMGILVGVRRGDRRISVISLAGRDIDDALGELVRVARATWTLLCHAGNMAGLPARC